MLCKVYYLLNIVKEKVNKKVYLIVKSVIISTLQFGNKVTLDKRTQ